MKREMKSAVSLTLIVCVTASVRPVTAQQPAAPPVTVCPLTRAITREAARLPAAGASTAGEVVQQSRRPVESNWSRVRRLASGRAIVVTVNGSPPGQRLVVAVGEAGLTLLNLTDPALPAAARDVLRDMAANHPGFFPVADKQSFVNGTVRVAPDGVFVTDRKVADLGQIVEHIPRTDVAEIKALSKSPQHWRRWLGGIVGWEAGGLVGAGVAKAAGCEDTGCSGGVVYGGLGGAVLGAVLGRRADRAATDGVIYRAP